MKLTELQSLIQKFNGSEEEMQSGRTHQELLRQLGLEPGSFYQELEMESRFVDTHRDVSYSNNSVNLHSHSFYELLYCTNSCDAEYLVGSERYRLQKGDIIFIAPGISHRPLLPREMTVPYQRDVVWISPEFFDILARDYPDVDLAHLCHTGLLRANQSRQELLGTLFRHGVREAENRRPGWELAVAGNTTLLLIQIYRAFLNRSAEPLQAEKPELPDLVMAYVEEHLQKKITLAEVARHFYVSESTISQGFRKKLGVSFYRYVTQRRLISAKALIEQGLHLETVSEQVGFTDYSTFYRAFKQEYGISPRQYRKMQDNSDQNV